LSSDAFSRQLLLVLHFHVSTVINHNPPKPIVDTNNVMMSFFEDIACTPVPQPSVRQALCPHAAHYIAHGPQPLEDGEETPTTTTEAEEIVYDVQEEGLLSNHSLTTRLRRAAYPGADRDKLLELRGDAAIHMLDKMQLVRATSKRSAPSSCFCTVARQSLVPLIEALSHLFVHQACICQSASPCFTLHTWSRDT
jgi:hypothetical protein